jgi:ABC-type bacteriocin/lantibiotic exporter with double-glycine peptidase domain
MLLTVVILVVGGYGVVRGDITIGHLLAFYAVAGMLSNYLRDMAGSLNPILAGYEALAQLNAFRAADSGPIYHGTKNVRFNGAIEFRHVSFGYENGPLVLRDVSLTLRPGLITAIMGPNGGGKSTLMNLALGLYRPQSGGLTADGLPYDEVDLHQLRCAVGVVAQDPILFDGTIRQNITYGCSNADYAALTHAATLAAAHAFICELPEGYDSRVGEGGVLLSGGQRQRIAIARAFLRQPKLLLLDEPTNHLDHDAVEQLIRNLRALPSRPTVLLVTHLKTIAAAADEVYELDQGELRPATARTATAAT